MIKAKINFKIKVIQTCSLIVSFFTVFILNYDSKLRLTFSQQILNAIRYESVIFGKLLKGNRPEMS